MSLIDYILGRPKFLSFSGAHGDPRHPELGFNITLVSENGREHVAHLSEMEARLMAHNILACLGEDVSDIYVDEASADY